MPAPEPPSFYGITYGAGDFVSLFSLFFDNLSTLLGFAGAILGLSATSTILPVILYERIIPAAGFMLFVGNCYYSYQAIRMTKKYGHPYTAQPYGLNTSGGFPFIFGIIYGVYYSITPECTADTCSADEILAEENDRVELAWRVCVTANFITGLINITFGFFGRFLITFFPLAAMLVPLAGIGFTWLALNQISANFANPAIGLVPVFLIFTQYYAGGRLHVYKNFYMPEALPVVIFGVIAGWLYGTQGDVVKPVSGGLWAGNAFLEGFSDVGDYIGVVLPFSIAASFGDIMVLVSAQKAGDPYPITETMVSDGLGTLIGAILGSPFGTVVYIGHPVHKRVGARTGYSFFNGIIYLVLCLSGIVPTILSLIPVVAIGPIIMIFGLMICEECTAHIAQRHHSVIFFGIFFGVADYIFTQYSPGQIARNEGVWAMSRGSALATMLWCSILVFTIDRRWIRAASFCCIAAFFAAIGVIHQANAIGKSFEFTKGSGGNITSTSPMEFMIGYLSLGVVCLLYHALQVYKPKTTSPEDEEAYEDDHGYLPPIDEPGVDGMFETWWDPVLKKDEMITKEKALEDDLPMEMEELEDEEA